MSSKKIYRVYKKEESDRLVGIADCQKRILSMFGRFCEFCDEHSISVFLLWGTLLGAKRGGKIIPWDDDVDLGASNDDFNKLLELREHLSKYNLKLVHFSINPHIHSNEIRIYEDGLYELCESNTKTYIKPVYIDIFPFCKVSKNDETDIIVNKIRKYSSLLIAKETRWKSTNVFKAFLRFIYRCLLSVVSSYRLHLRIEKCITRLYDGSSDYEITFPDTFHNVKINYFEKDSFTELEPIMFEDIKCLVPAKSDYVLTKAYGNWKVPKDRSSGKIFEKHYLIRKQ